MSRIFRGCILISDWGLYLPYVYNNKTLKSTNYFYFKIYNNNHMERYN